MFHRKITTLSILIFVSIHSMDSHFKAFCEEIDATGKTFLHHAIKGGNADKWRSGALIDEVPIEEYLHTILTTNAQLISHIIKVGVDVNIFDKNRRTPLLYAAKYKNEAATKLLLEAGADPNIRSREGIPPLVIACSIENNAAIITALLGAGARFCDLLEPVPPRFATSFETDDVTILESALKTCPVNAVALLSYYYTTKQSAFNFKAFSEKIDPTGKTFLHHTIEGGNADKWQSGAMSDEVPSEEYLHNILTTNAQLISYIIKANVNVNIYDETNRRRTPLFYATKYKNEAAIKLLLEAGADPNIRNKEGIPPLVIACSIKNNATIITALLKGGARFCDLLEPVPPRLANSFEMDENKDATILESALKTCPVNALALLPYYYTTQQPSCKRTFNLKAFSEKIDSTGKTFLHHAIKGGNADKWRSGALIDEVLSEEYLHTILTTNAQLISHIIKAGVNVNILDGKRRTPLLYAEKYKNEAATKLLLEAGADPNIRNKAGIPPLVIACSKDATILEEGLAKEKAGELSSLEAQTMPDAHKKGSLFEPPQNSNCYCCQIL